MSRPRKHANATARAQSSRAEMLAKGWRPVQVWLSQEQIAKLGADKSAAVRNWLDSQP